MPYAFLSAAIVLEVIATLMLKQSDGWRAWQWGMASVAAYSLAGLCFALALRQLNLGLAYAIWSGAGIALICVASVILWQQSVDLAAAAGLVLIGTGIGLITLQSQVVLQ